MCRSLFGHSDKSTATVSAQVAWALSVAGDEPSDARRFAALPALAALVDAAAAADPGWRALDPEERRHRTVEALWTLVERRSAARPLLLVVEDLHWADPETVAALGRIAEEVARARVLMLVDYRPEAAHDGWSSLLHAATIRVSAFTGEDAERLTGALLGKEGARAPLAGLLTERAGGNPFFAEEIVEALVEEGVLQGAPGAYRVAAPVHEPGVPLTVRAVLAARIDRLALGDKRLLEAAAVIGKTFSGFLLAEVAGTPESRVHRGLRRLAKARFLRSLNDDGGRRHTFRHALTHEVAYSGLPLARRRAMHGRVLDALERLHAGRLGDQVEVLTYHAALARRWDETATYARQAGAKAVARSANREAVALFEQALAAVAELPESEVTYRLTIDIRFELRYPLFRLGMISRVLERLREAEPLAERLATDRGWRSSRFF